MYQEPPSWWPLLPQWYNDIHPSVHFLSLLIPHTESWGGKRGQAAMHIHTYLELLINLMCMSLDCERKLEHPQRTLATVQATAPRRHLV